MTNVSATLVGGMGNQMFVAAAAFALAQRLDTGVEFRTDSFRSDPNGRSFALGAFPNVLARSTLAPPRRQLPMALQRRLDAHDPRVFTERSAAFDPRFDGIASPVQLNGYFQSPRYFHDLPLPVDELFDVPGDNAVTSTIVSALGTDWFAMHVRRGDYMQSSTAAYHGLCSDEYFLHGLEALRRQSGRALPVALFTDSPEHISSRLRSVADLVVGPDPGRHESIDLVAMSHASGLVLSNSSYSWWAGYLRERPDRVVVAPRPWFRHNDSAASDLLLPHWLTLGAQA